MSGLFDRLNKKLDDEAQGGGMSALDLVNLSPGPRYVMRLLLRELELTWDEIQEASYKFPDDGQMNEGELDEVLTSLIRDLWVIKKGHGDSALYEANLRRKAPSKLAQSIWASLHERIEEGAEGADLDT